MAGRAARQPGALRVPQRGDKRALAETVARNAAQALDQHKLKRASDLTARSRALGELQEALGPADGAAADRVLRHQPRAGHQRGGQHGGVRGRPGPQERVPPVRDARAATGDTDWIAEVVRRRFARYLDEQVDDGATDADGRRRRGAPAASTRRPAGRASSPTRRTCVVVDGGAPQVAAAQAVLAELGIDDVALVGLAKRLEEVWLPGERVPGDPAAHLRGAVPAAAGPRRGAPVRDHLPPAEAVASR